jgi:ABC-type tungstate transport system permease subunit
LGSSGTNTPNLALFTNVKANVYWTGTKYAPDANSAWYFATGGGNQTYAQTGAAMYAVAVRDGDVTAVPEPEAAAVMLVGLGILTLAVRRRRA